MSHTATATIGFSDIVPATRTARQNSIVTGISTRSISLTVDQTVAGKIATEGQAKISLTPDTFTATTISGSATLSDFASDSEGIDGVDFTSITSILFIANGKFLVTKTSNSWAFSTVSTSFTGSNNDLTFVSKNIGSSANGKTITFAGGAALAISVSTGNVTITLPWYSATITATGTTTPAFSGSYTFGGVDANNLPYWKTGTAVLVDAFTQSFTGTGNIIYTDTGLSYIVHVASGVKDVGYFIGNNADPTAVTAWTPESPATGTISTTASSVTKKTAAQLAEALNADTAFSALYKATASEGTGAGYPLPDLVFTFSGGASGTAPELIIGDSSGKDQFASFIFPGGMASNQFLSDTFHIYSATTSASTLTIIISGTTA